MNQAPETPPARGGEGEQREKRRPGRDDIEEGGDEGRGEDLLDRSCHLALR